jgi:fatty acid desaturase
MQVLSDLVIVCVLALLWMVRDAKTSGVTPWPFVVLTLAAGAFGPLFYLVAREVKAGSRVAA